MERFEVGHAVASLARPLESKYRYDSWRSKEVRTCESLRAEAVYFLNRKGAFRGVQTVRAAWKLSGAYLKAESLVATDLSDSILTGANLEVADLSAARLAGAVLEGVHCERAKFDGADLRGADLYWASAFQASFRGADLTGADLRGGDFKAADFTGANLTDANFGKDNLNGSTIVQGADFSEAILRGATFEAARYDLNTRFPETIEPKANRMILVDEKGREF